MKEKDLAVVVGRTEVRFKLVGGVDFTEGSVEEA